MKGLAEMRRALPRHWKGFANFVMTFSNQKGLDLPMPTTSEVRVFRLTPAIVSLLDYSKGFGYADLIVC